MGLIRAQFSKEVEPTCDKIPGPKGSGTRARPGLDPFVMYGPHQVLKTSNSRPQKEREILNRLKYSLKNLNGEFATWGINGPGIVFLPSVIGHGSVGVPRALAFLQGRVLPKPPPL